MSSGVFGDETESAVLHEVDCFGNETDILSCSMSTLGLQSEHSASVICQGIIIRASVDALSRDGPGQISRERVQRGRLTRQGTTS